MGFSLGKLLSELFVCLDDYDECNELCFVRDAYVCLNDEGLFLDSEDECDELCFV